MEGGSDDVDVDDEDHVIDRRDDCYHDDNYDDVIKSKK